MRIISRLTLLTLFTGLMLALLTGGQSYAKKLPASSDKSIYEIGHMQIEFRDPMRNMRSIPTELYYPLPAPDKYSLVNPGSSIAQDGYPLVVFGHGFVMSWSAYENLWTYLVPRGYIMAFPRTESGISPSHLDFALDLSFLADTLRAISSQPEHMLYGYFNGKAAVMGHSMGGGAAVLAASLNPGIDALLGLAPAETSPSAIEAAAQISIPALIMAGTSDDVTPPSTHQLPIFSQISSTEKIYAALIGGGHCYFANFNFFCNLGESGTSGNISLSREEQQQAVAHLSDAWLSFWLKSDCDAWNSLQDSLSQSPIIESDVHTHFPYPLLCHSIELMVSPPATGEAHILHTGPYIDGQTVEVLAQSAPGYRFKGWYDGQILLSGDSLYAFQILAPIMLTAVFEEFDTGTKPDESLDDSAWDMQLRGQNLFVSFTQAANEGFLQIFNNKATGIYSKRIQHENQIHIDLNHHAPGLYHISGMYAGKRFYRSFMLAFP